MATILLQTLSVMTLLLLVFLSLTVSSTPLQPISLLKSRYNPLTNEHTTSSNGSHSSLSYSSAYTIIKTGQHTKLRNHERSNQGASETLPSDLPELVTTAIVSESPLATYVPPPKTDITPALIEQSLSIQPQQNATVHSVVPHFSAGTITFYIQLDGPVPQSLQLNATDSIPCGAIGTKPDPNLILVPRKVRDGTLSYTIPDCLIIAVNKYNTSWINYWVQKIDGSHEIYSLLGDAKVHDIDQLDPGQPAALQVGVASSAHLQTRSTMHPLQSVPLNRHQVLSVRCNRPCSTKGMHKIVGRSGYCGCIAGTTRDRSGLFQRGVEMPGTTTAIMTPEACSAMICINNGDSPALYNPFTRTCWCSAPIFIDINPSAHDLST